MLWNHLRTFCFSSLTCIRVYYAFGTVTKVLFIISHLRYENKCHEFTIYCTQHTHKSKGECWTKCFKTVSAKEDVFDRGIYPNIEDGEQTLPMNNTWWVFMHPPVPFHCMSTAATQCQTHESDQHKKKTHNTTQHNSVTYEAFSKKHVCLQSKPSQLCGCDCTRF